MKLVVVIICHGFRVSLSEGYIRSTVYLTCHCHRTFPSAISTKSCSKFIKFISRRITERCYYSNARTDLNFAFYKQPHLLRLFACSCPPALCSTSLNFIPPTGLRLSVSSDAHHSASATFINLSLHYSVLHIHSVCAVHLRRCTPTVLRGYVSSYLPCFVKLPLFIVKPCLLYTSRCV